MATSSRRRKGSGGIRDLGRQPGQPRGHSVYQLRASLGRDPVSGDRRERTEVFRGTMQQAEERLAKMLAEVGIGRFTATGATVTLDKLLAEWLAFRRHAPSTEKAHRSVIERHISPNLGDITLDRLTSRHLDDLYRTLCAPEPLGRGLAPASVVRIHAIIAAALDQAMRWAWITMNPAMRATKPRIDQKEIVPPSHDLVDRAIEAAERYSPQAGVAIRLAAATGARRGELCALRWTKFDPVAGTIRIDRALSYGAKGLLLEKQPKTRSGVRDVTLDAETAQVLVAWRRHLDAQARKQGDRPHPEGFVLSADACSASPMHPNYLSLAWQRIRRRVPGLEHVRLHDLRHYHITTLLEAGVPLPAVARRMGHSSAVVTQGTLSRVSAPATLGYAHGTKAGELAAVEAYRSARGKGRP